MLASLEASAGLTDKVGILPKSTQFTTQFYFNIWELQSEKSRVKLLRNNSPRGQQDGLDSLDSLDSKGTQHQSQQPELQPLDPRGRREANTPFPIKKKLKISLVVIRQQLWECSPGGCVEQR